MNDFDRRWQDCVARARQAPARPATAPFGFTTRVLAAVEEPARGALPALLWQRLGLRALVAVTTALVVLGTMEYRDARSPSLALPRVEHGVTATFWML
jgi:hypothetical protein